MKKKNFFDTKIKPAKKFVCVSLTFLFTSQKIIKTNDKVKQKFNVFFISYEKKFYVPLAKIFEKFFFFKFLRNLRPTHRLCLTKHVINIFSSKTYLWCVTRRTKIVLYSFLLFHLQSLLLFILFFLSFWYVFFSLVCCHLQGSTEKRLCL